MAWRLHSKTALVAVVSDKRALDGPAAFSKVLVLVILAFPQV